MVLFVALCVFFKRNNALNIFFLLLPVFSLTQSFKYGTSSSYSNDSRCALLPIEQQMEQWD